MTEYYTYISKKQLNVLNALKGTKINITKNMLNYLYSLERQGKTFLRDNSSEEFRQKIKECIGRAIMNREKADEQEYKSIEKDIIQAFRIFCASHTSRYLKEVKKELDSMP